MKKPCHHRNVTRYGDVWQCILCGLRFKPVYKPPVKKDEK